MNSITRRKFFASTGSAALSSGAAMLSLGTAAKASNPDGPVRYNRAASTMKFEVTHTEAEWLEKLETFEYFIMRKGLTEERKSSPLWEETAAGTYHCKGCNLPVYQSNQKVIHDIGFVFFYHAEPDSVLMAVEGNIPEQYGAMGASTAGMVELHCRRCASHLGHFVIIEDVMTHCINGTSLLFVSTAA